LYEVVHWTYRLDRLRLWARTSASCAVIGGIAELLVTRSNWSK